ncbi:hypothetical protein A2382_04425 [Candidatus Woesebacteria bacterium RIFOXYB1_FULL_38_16]|uniref:TrbL/VirB6 plasmid conjugal transfer protein n=1 Tax=Candidatus Woesebacteria bacterium RIFOXYB1_FULL_38_16 TaxID=1802538 RepID=A0A1F8CU09_9BACT|nr:MAG: hypothetical protein A2191_00965 [Candidatus Woesebacteria bacterium RIFOXYA1_FULL_38_9]OGM79814.1 MAG: hypothetical protein A2382_04425 [Candidatus Woesebacteria bacterium RIFOXYB1_FULL_38_16]
MKLFTKILTSLLLAIFLFVNLAPKPAQATWYNQNMAEWYKHVYDDQNPTEIFGERYTAAQVDWIIMTFITWPFTKVLGPKVMSCAFEAIGGQVDAGTCTEALREKFTASPTSIHYANLTPATNTERLIDKVFQERSLSGVHYIKNKLQQLEIVPTVQAQTGFGYTAYGPLIQSIWQAIRDFTYALFVIITIILAFMIMFRVQLNPRTVISIQSALPKLAIALVLVTFSYAISGLLVDLMYVSIGILSLFLKDIIPLGPGLNMFDLLTKGILGTGIWGYLIFDFVFMLLSLVFGLITLGSGIGNLLVIPSLVGIFFAVILPVGSLVFMGILVFFLILSFKILWLLMKTTATLILKVIFSPLYIALGVISPQLGFSNWVKEYIADLSVFPVTSLLFALSHLFLTISLKVAIKDALIFDNLRDALFNTPGSYDNIFGNGWPPLLGTAGDPTALIFLGISIALLAIIPSTASMVKSFFMGKPFGYGQAIGESFGSAKNYTSAQAQTYLKAYSGAPTRTSGVMGLLSKLK